MLEYAEPYIIQEPMLKNRTCQTYRWKQLAMSDDLKELELHLTPYTRIIGRTLNVLRKHTQQY